MQDNEDIRVLRVQYRIQAFHKQWMLERRITNVATSQRVWTPVTTEAHTVNAAFALAKQDSLAMLQRYLPLGVNGISVDYDWVRKGGK